MLGKFLFFLKGISRRFRRVILTEAKRILIVRIDELGDLVLTTPFLRELRRVYPESFITLLANPRFCQIIELCPYIDEIITYDREAHSPYFGRRQLFSFAKKNLWDKKYELAIDPRFDFDPIGLQLLFLSGASLRVAYSQDVGSLKQLRRDFRTDQLLTHVIHDPLPDKHEVERNLNVLKFMGCKIKSNELELWLSEEDRLFAQKFIEERKWNQNEMLIVSAVGAGHERRQWPVRRYIEVFENLHEKYRVKFLLIGAEKDKPLGKIIEEKAGAWIINSIGKTTLRQMAALIEKCRLYLGNDTGPMHIASALKVPVVAIYGPSDPISFGPWKVAHRIVRTNFSCSPCKFECPFDDPRCMTEISPEEVIAATVEMIEGAYE